MNEFKYSPITIKYLQECHRINEDNVPNVGTKEFEDFGELINNSDTAHDRVSFIHKKLMDRGYRCIHTDGVTDFLYIIEE